MSASAPTGLGVSTPRAFGPAAALAAPPLEYEHGAAH